MLPLEIRVNTWKIHAGYETGHCIHKVFLTQIYTSVMYYICIVFITNDYTDEKLDSFSEKLLQDIITCARYVRDLFHVYLNKFDFFCGCIQIKQTNFAFSKITDMSLLWPKTQNC